MTFNFKFSRLFFKIYTPESFFVLFFTTKVSTLISVEGGEALSRSQNDKIPKGDVTPDDLQRRFYTQNIITALL